MSSDILYGKQWWAWWSDPLMGLHNDHAYRLSLGPDEPPSLEFLRLLEIRSSCELSDLPDPELILRPAWRALALASDETLVDRLWSLSTLTLGPECLTANSAEWGERYGVHSAEQIRELIRIRAELPPTFMMWQDQVCRVLQRQAQPLRNLLGRIKLVLALLQTTVMPRVQARWSLCLPLSILELVKQIDKPQDKVAREVMDWIQPSIETIMAEQLEQYALPDLDLPDTEDMARQMQALFDEEEFEDRV